MKLTVFKSRRGRPSQYLQQALQLSSNRQPLAEMVQNNLNIQENNSTDKVAKQNALSDTGITDESKENHNILQRPLSQLNTTGAKSPEKYFGSMDSNIALHPYGSTTMSTPKTSVLSNGHHRQNEEVDNLRTPMREDTSVSYSDESHNSTPNSSSSSEADVSRSPMSISDSSVEVSPETTVRTVPSPLSAPKETSTPLQAPPQQPARRRPGRPPGSTKKRMQSFAEYKKKGDSNGSSADDFSLRKFFEAGGRDYNEYLDWLKKRQQSQQNATTIMMNHLPPYPSISSSMLPTTTTTHTSNLAQFAQFATSPPVFNGSKSPMTLPPPPYRPMLVPRPSTLHPGARPDMVPVPVTVPSIQSFPTILTAPVPAAAPAPISPQTHRHPAHLPTQLPRQLQNHDSNALDLSAPTRKRRSEGGSSSEDELPSPTPSCAKLSRDMSGSPVAMTTVLTTPVCRSPTSAGSPRLHGVTNNQAYKADINGNLTSPFSATENGDGVEPTIESDISSWDVENVVRFINSVPDCQEYSEVFREHKIDGATLPHLSEEHLLKFVKMKLGPAIKLRLAIARLNPVAAQ